MTRYIIAGCCLLTLSACGNNTTAKTSPPEYIYQTKIADLSPTVWTNNGRFATERVNKRVAFNAKNECRKLGYGWMLDEVKNSGELSCEKRADGRSRCQKSNVEIEFRRLKPGTVGMGMIPFLQ